MSHRSTQSRTLDISFLKEKLVKEIEKKRQQLTKHAEALEQLKIELLTIKYEYDRRIGSLYVRLNELSLEIIRLRQILELQKKGMSAEKAALEVDARLEEQREQIRFDYEEIHEETEALENRETDTAKLEELKSLWRKLVSWFHPDLVQDQRLKKKYEELIKGINKAFFAGDYDKLKSYELMEDVPEQAEDSMDNLRKQLKEIEDGIKSVKKELRLMRKTEWYTWKMYMENGEREGIDVFADLEMKLQSEVAEKEAQLSSLNREFAQ